MTVAAKAIRAALKKATPGPWDIEDETFGHGDAWIGQMYVGMEGVDAKQAARDAELIVLLRNNAEALLDALEQTEQARDRATQALWDVRLNLGFDNDGDPTPKHVGASGNDNAMFCKSVVNDATAYRLDEEGAEYELAEELSAERAKVARVAHLIDVGSLEDERLESQFRAALMGVEQ